MEFAGRALGHRVWQSIENYMANHPKVIEAIKSEVFDDAQCEHAMQKAFEEAIDPVKKCDMIKGVVKVAE